MRRLSGLWIFIVTAAFAAPPEPPAGYIAVPEAGWNLRLNGLVWPESPFARTRENDQVTTSAVQWRSDVSLARSDIGLVAPISLFLVLRDGSRLENVALVRAGYRVDLHIQNPRTSVPFATLGEFSLGDVDEPGANLHYSLKLLIPNVQVVKADSKEGYGLYLPYTIGELSSLELDAAQDPQGSTLDELRFLVVNADEYLTPAVVQHFPAEILAYRTLIQSSSDDASWYGAGLLRCPVRYLEAVSEFVHSITRSYPETLNNLTVRFFNKRAAHSQESGWKPFYTSSIVSNPQAAATKLSSLLALRGAPSAEVRKALDRWIPEELVPVDGATIRIEASTVSSPNRPTQLASLVLPLKDGACPERLSQKTP